MAIAKAHCPMCDTMTPTSAERRQRFLAMYDDYIEVWHTVTVCAQCKHMRMSKEDADRKLAVGMNDAITAWLDKEGL